MCFWQCFPTSPKRIKIRFNRLWDRDSLLCRRNILQSGAGYEDDGGIVGGSMASSFCLAIPEPTFPGDANRDGLADQVDAVIVAGNWQRTDGAATWADGDFNHDGMVNDIDATILAANWALGTSAPVPESGTITLLLCGLAGLALLRRRR